MNSLHLLAAMGLLLPGVGSAHAREWDPVCEDGRSSIAVALPGSGAPTIACVSFDAGEDPDSLFIVDDTPRPAQVSLSTWTDGAWVHADVLWSGNWGWREERRAIRVVRAIPTLPRPGLVPVDEQGTMVDLSAKGTVARSANSLPGGPDLSGVPFAPLGDACGVRARRQSAQEPVELVVVCDDAERLLASGQVKLLAAGEGPGGAFHIVWTSSERGVEVVRADKPVDDWKQVLVPDIDGPVEHAAITTEGIWVFVAAHSRQITEVFRILPSAIAEEPLRGRVLAMVETGEGQPAVVLQRGSRRRLRLRGSAGHPVRASTRLPSGMVLLSAAWMDDGRVCLTAGELARRGPDGPGRLHATCTEARTPKR